MRHLAEAGACAGSRQLPVSGMKSECAAGSKIRFLQTRVRANPGSLNPDMMFICINKKINKNGTSRMLKIPNQNQDANQEVCVNTVVEHVVQKEVLFAVHCSGFLIHVTTPEHHTCNCDKTNKLCGSQFRSGP